MNIMITGASRGIGYETVKKLVLKDNYTILALSRNKGKLDNLVQTCLKINSSAVVIPIQFDLTNGNFIELINKIGKHVSSIDILINNAGFLVNKLFKETDIKDARSIFNVNFFAPSLLIKNLLPFFIKSKKSHIVNISSMGGFQGSQKFEGLSYYSASKAALASLTECLAMEFKEDNISVNCLALGAVQTEMLSEAFPGYKAPLQASEMAEKIADFAINGDKYYNGKILPVSLSTP